MKKISIGTRGGLLNSFVAWNNLTVANQGADEDADEIWTFESSLGYPRRIDFVLVSKTLSVLRSHPSNDIDLGSDHRSVYAQVCVPEANLESPQRCASYKWNGSPSYGSRVSCALATAWPESVESVQDLVFNAALTSGAVSSPKATRRQWDTQELKDLRDERRSCRVKARRSFLSKLIQKKTRIALRAWQTERLRERLENFNDLKQLSRICQAPVEKRACLKPVAAEFVQSLKQVYTSDSMSDCVVDSDGLSSIPEIHAQEVCDSLRNMKRGKRSDRHNIVMEMFSNGGPDLHQCLAGVFKKIMRNGYFPAGWRDLVLTMLPKSGNLVDPANWRPIAILDACYKLFSKVLHGRLVDVLEREQSDEQMGFRPKRGADDAFIVLESVVSRALEFNSPVWIVSVDLSKAFDRIEYHALFEALRRQGVPTPYISLLRLLYRGQRGFVQGEAFSVTRGVRQGDIISPALFNAALEDAMRRWKLRIESYGLSLSPSMTLTNLRYADDLLLFSSTLHGAQMMLEALQIELGQAGLSINKAKTKILTTVADYSCNPTPLLVEVGDGMVEVVRGDALHKYLGKVLPGNLRARGVRNLDHRLSCGWLKFRSLASTLLNRKICLALRLRLFDSCVSPSVLYSLSTTPLTAAQLERLNATQRIMLRKIVGWVRWDDESWSETGHRMKAKLTEALRQHPVKNWSDVRNQQRTGLLHRIEHGFCPSMLCAVHSWQPSTSRSRGRPKQRWTD